MQTVSVHLDAPAIISLIVAMALAISKLPKGTLDGWVRSVPWAPMQRALPGVALFAGQVPSLLAHAATWGQLGFALLLGVAFAMPGSHAYLAILRAAAAQADKGGASSGSDDEPPSQAPPTARPVLI